MPRSKIAPPRRKAARPKPFASFDKKLDAQLAADAELEGPPDFLEERIAAAMKYRPRADEGSLLLARIHDGDAVVPWQGHDGVPHFTSENVADGGWVEPADLVRGEDLLRMIAEAFGSGDREVLSRVEAATKLLRGAPRTEGERLARYVSSITASLRQEVRLLRRVNARRAQPTFDLELEQRDMRAYYLLVRDGLARWHDPAFAQLDPKRVYEEFAAFNHDADKQPAPATSAKEYASDKSVRERGGRNHALECGIAARLAVEVDAFGSARIGVAAFRARLQTERSRNG